MRNINQRTRHQVRIIQIRNVPEELHCRLQANTSAVGLSLSAYLLEELRCIADRPTPVQFCEGLRMRRRLGVDLDTARLLREERRR